MTHGGHPGSLGLSFEVLAEVAVGATSRVEVCRTLAPVKGQLIAVKRLLPEIASDPSNAHRFLDEVWMTSSLRHPNVVGVMGWGHDERGAYLAVDLVQGVSLERLMKTVVDTREEFPERLVVYICASIARGLAAAHELKSDRGEPLALVHRDLTPSNVLVGFNGDVKVADFGLATAKNRMTQTTGALPSRSVSHLAPEDLRGEQIDARADIYGVGVILYELITGHAAFSGKDELETSRNVLAAAVPDPMRYRPRMDRTLAQLIARCMERDRSRRPASAREVCRELEGWLTSHGYRDDNVEALARFVRRNSVRQMRWFERVIGGGEATGGDPQSVRAPTKAPEPPGVREPSRESISKDTETTVVEKGDKETAAARRRAAIRAPETMGHPGIPKLNQDDDEEEGENVTTVALKRPLLPALQQPRVNPPTLPARPTIVEETTSDSIELLEDPSTDDHARKAAAPPPVPPRPAFRASPSSPPIDSATMTLPTQLLAPEYVAHQVERLRGNAQRKVIEAKQAREEAEAARLEAEAAEEEAQQAERAVAMALEALQLAKDSKVSSAAEKLEEALSLVDGPQ